MVATTTASKKSKGRNLQKKIAEDIRAHTGLSEDDVQSRSSSVAGSDIMLSSAAIAKFPFSVEAKNQESLAIWKALQQAQDNAAIEKRTPILVFKRNRSEIMVALKWDDFLRIYFNKK